MISETYDYLPSESKNIYIFESKGEQRSILKGIVFSQFEGNLWNLAFGDIQNGDINDSVVSNNQDIVKIIGTIAKIVYEFSNQYPNRDILINPVDDKRKKLYNHVFRRHFDTIKLDFHVTGISDGVDEDYSPEKVYDIFKLKRKFVK